MAYEQYDNELSIYNEYLSNFETSQSLFRQALSEKNWKQAKIHFYECQDNVGGMNMQKKQILTYYSDIHWKRSNNPTAMQNAVETAKAWIEQIEYKNPQLKR